MKISEILFCLVFLLTLANCYDYLNQANWTGSCNDWEIDPQLTFLANSISTSVRQPKDIRFIGKIQSCSLEPRTTKISKPIILTIPGSGSRTKQTTTSSNLSSFIFTILRNTQSTASAIL